jgi:hypothetical protein
MNAPFPTMKLTVIRDLASAASMSGSGVASASGGRSASQRALAEVCVTEENCNWFCHGECQSCVSRGESEERDPFEPTAAAGKDANS